MARPSPGAAPWTARPSAPGAGEHRPRPGGRNRPHVPCHSRQRDPPSPRPGRARRLWTRRGQAEGHPAQHETDGFAARQHVDDAGTLLVIVGAYGPDWFTTMREARHRLEQPYIKCHVDGEAPRLADNELLVRWATSAELQARAAIQEASQAPLKALLRQGEAQQQRAEEQRQALEDAGQSGLFRRHRPRSCALRGPPFLRPPTLARALSSRCATPAQVCPVGLRRPPQHERGPYAGCRRRTFTLKQPQLPAGCFR